MPARVHCPDIDLSAEDNQVVVDQLLITQDLPLRLLEGIIAMEKVKVQAMASMEMEYRLIIAMFL